MKIIDNSYLRCFCLVFLFVNYNLLSVVTFLITSSFDRKLGEQDGEDFCCIEMDGHELTVLLQTLKGF